MSTVLEKVAPDLSPTAPPLPEDAPKPKQKRVDRRKNRNRPYKAKLATKVKWALGDTMEKAISAQSRMVKILAWIDEQRAYDAGDSVRRARLGDLDHEVAYLALEVAEMERILKRAIDESKIDKDEFRRELVAF